LRVFVLDFVHNERSTVHLEVLQMLLAQRVLILDGAMGTMIQAAASAEEAFRCERFKNHGTTSRATTNCWC